MKSKDDEGDVIGIAGTANSYLMKWETARHGVAYKLEAACIEAPTGGTEDTTFFVKFLCSSHKNILSRKPGAKQYHNV